MLLVLQLMPRHPLTLHTALSAKGIVPPTRFRSNIESEKKIPSRQSTFGTMRHHLPHLPLPHARRQAQWIIRFKRKDASFNISGGYWIMVEISSQKSIVTGGPSLHLSNHEWKEKNEKEIEI